MRSGPEIQEALRRLAAKWGTYDGGERAEAQTFLNELFAAYGGDRLAIGARFEDFTTSAGFMDLHWPGVCIFEMKRPGSSLAKAREQIHRYWMESDDPSTETSAARFVVLCSFGEFEIWEPGSRPSSPRATVALADLADRYEVLGFLIGPNIEPTFIEHHRLLTTTATKLVADLYRSMSERSAAPPDELLRFVMQTVWCLFAERLQMLQGWPLENTVKNLLDNSTRSPAAEIGHLFRLLNQRGDHNRRGVLSGTTYVNGDLFANPAAVDLSRDELLMLLEASRSDWSKVNPTIFGSLLEGLLGKDRRDELGAHYTHEADIMKIVTPTIIRPWRDRIAALTSPTAGRQLLDELCGFRVLDPACGCGNFLYVAYRELRGLESELKERIRVLAQDKGLAVPPGPWPFFPLSNMLGIDIEHRAVSIARVVLWMGHRQMIGLYGEAEDPLPLVDLSGIRQADALRVPWPECDAIIGNPPFYGSQWLRGALGDDYVSWLSKEFGVGIKDLCTYWFRRAADHLQPGQRAGLVGTNSIAQNRARSASLDYVLTQGGVITDAISTQKWPGEAKVHVSLVNWIDEPADPPKPFLLDGLEVAGIGADLTESLPGAWTPVLLLANAGRCFQGPIPVGAGFILTEVEARSMLARDDAFYREVVRPYLIGEDIAEAPDQGPSRWTIDFDNQPLQDAQRFAQALEIVRERVRPEREKNRDKRFRERWWQFGRSRGELRAAIKPLRRSIAAPRVGKRFLVCWVNPPTLASDSTNTFAFDDDFAAGVLSSRTHGAWAWHQASTFKGDLRYTPTSVFMTFPWPDGATAEQRERVAEASRRLLARRSEICLTEQVGLTTLYNRVDDGAYTDLMRLHRDLDEAVVACYGWPRSAAQDDRELVVRLTDLNQQIAQGRPYRPFAHLDRAAPPD